MFKHGISSVMNTAEGGHRCNSLHITVPPPHINQLFQKDFSINLIYFHLTAKHGDDNLIVCIHH